MTPFKFKTQIRVRNYEVDWQGIVHNATYLLYFEVSRIEYLHHVGNPVNRENIVGESKIVLVRNEIDYKSSARFDDLLDVYTRVSSIKNTSFIFQGEMREASTNRLVALNTAFHVWLDPENDKPVRVPDHFRSIIRRYENGDFVE